MSDVGTRGSKLISCSEFCPNDEADRRAIEALRGSGMEFAADEINRIEAEQERRHARCLGAVPTTSLTEVWGCGLEHNNERLGIVDGR